LSRTETLVETSEREVRRTVSPLSPPTTGAFLRALILALRNNHDRATGEHGERTCALAVRAAVELGLKDLSRVRHIAVLHDVGKLGVPRSILHKPSELSETEWRVMRRHPAMGANLLRSIAGFGPVRTAILAHHERFDGRGYPLGLAGTRIPIEARLICVVDAYDAMTSERPYRSALSHAEAIERLNRGAGTQFDPAMVEAVESVLG
jgi:HD-GYP domain-containing protein (c-di-GMP phosphodiesterase class II)